MTDTELREQGPPKIIDNSIRTTLGKNGGCWRQSYFFFRGIEHRITPPYFVFGQAWQLMQVHWYSFQEEVDAGISPERRKEIVDSCLNVGTKHWIESGTYERRNDSLTTLHTLFRLYVEEHPKEIFKVLGSEKGWEWPIIGTPYSLGGSLDHYIERKEWGTLAMENKTTGIYLTDQYIEQWSYSPQVTTYIWYLSQLLGREIFGCYMNLATKRIPKANVFSRPLERRSSFQLEEFLENVLEDFADLEKMWDRWNWPKTANPINCAGGIGKSPCLFRPFCLMDAHPWEVDVTLTENMQWRPEKWEPWKRG